MISLILNFKELDDFIQFYNRIKLKFYYFHLIYSNDNANKIMEYS